MVRTVRVLYLYGLHLDVACAPDVGTFLEPGGVKFADQFSVPVVPFGMRDDRNILNYPVVDILIL
jgi:hypothetical protein